ncbi:MAG TPA: hypothetical protein VFE60_06800 [Roseiarcus sp.]|nr:hypothetical protein [Roseiarcus sp.]
MIGLALLASLPGWFIATVAIGAFAFAMARKHAPNFWASIPNPLLPCRSVDTRR